jgi:hypothetical protein
VPDARAGSAKQTTAGPLIGAPWRIVPEERAGSATRERERALAELASRQSGVVSRAQLLALGHTRSAISHRLAQGRLHRLHAGVFAVGHLVVPPAGHRLAAVLACGEGAVASHLTAGAAWGLRSHSSGDQHVTVLPGNGSRSRGRLRVHRHRLAVEDISVADSLRVTTLGRTLIDLGDLLPAEHVRRAFIRAEQLRVIDMAELDGALDRAGRRRGPAILRGILRAYDPRWQATRSGLELRALDLVRDTALPQPEVNAWIAGRWEANLLWRDACCMRARRSWPTRTGSHARSAAHWDAPRRIVHEERARSATPGRGPAGQCRPGSAYQCTPFIRLAIAICSIEAFSFGSLSPLAAAESGKTL